MFVIPGLAFLLFLAPSFCEEAFPYPCCTVPYCDEVDIGVEGHTAMKCYSKRTCGDACRKNVQRIPNPSHWPNRNEFRIRDRYVKTICKSDKCSSYSFDCSICPNPRDRAVLAPYVYRDCVNCYY